MILALQFGLQVIAFLTILITWKSIKPVYLLFTAPLLGITLLNERIIVPALRKHHFSADIAYNIFSVFDMFIWAFVFYRIYKEKHIQKFLFVLTITAIIYSLLDIFILSGIKILHVNSMMLYDLSIVLLAGNLLYILLKKEFYQPASDSLFWISAACIGYHSLLFLNFATLWLPKEYWDQPKANYVWEFVSLSEAVFYYLLLSIAFLTCTNYKFRRI